MLTHTTHAARFTEIVSKLNPKFAVRHLQVTDVGPQTAVQMSEIIEAGHWIVIVADRTPIGSSACVSVPFLGEEAPLALGPFLLATLLKCSAWSMICVRETEAQSKARYRVAFTRVYDGATVPRAKRSQTLSAMANAWVRTLETRLLKSPYDWFNFFDFCILRKADKLRKLANTSTDKTDLFIQTLAKVFWQAVLRHSKMTGQTRVR